MMKQKGCVVWIGLFLVVASMGSPAMAEVDLLCTDGSVEGGAVEVDCEECDDGSNEHLLPCSKCEDGEIVDYDGLSEAECSYCEDGEEINVPEGETVRGDAPDLCKVCDGFGTAVDREDCAEIPGEPCKRCEGGVVKDLEVVIETTPKMICKSVESYTISLSDTFTCNDVTWDGVPGVSNGSTFTFNPSEIGEGEYTITASIVGCVSATDSVRIKITTWPCIDDQEDTFGISPNITAEQIKALGNLDNFEVSFQKQLDEIEEKIHLLADQISPEDEQALEDRYSLNPVGTFTEWLAERINEAKQEALNQIDQKIAEASQQIPDLVDQFASNAADEINDTYSINATVKAKYQYNCDSFSPADPGWSDPELQPLVVDNIEVRIGVGFAVDIALEPAGVGIGSLPVSSLGEIKMGVVLTGFHGSPESWSPTAVVPNVTSKAKMNAAYTVTSQVNAEALVKLEFGLAFGGNIGFPDEKYEFQMSATDDCVKILDW